MKKVLLSAIILLTGMALMAQTYTDSVNIANVTGTNTHDRFLEDQAYSWSITIKASSLAGTKDGEVVIYAGNKDANGNVMWTNIDTDEFPLTLSQDTTICYTTSYNKAQVVRVLFTKNNLTGGNFQSTISKFGYIKPR
ncbi:MAG: hypothetical protein GY861_26055 [bacterium]|nr:hypothetical protein [bacterium]